MDLKIDDLLEKVRFFALSPSLTLTDYPSPIAKGQQTSFGSRIRTVERPQGARPS
jgi:hypothetical protein